jgi:PD-(D/E)XK nuclease superfamily
VLPGLAADGGRWAIPPLVDRETGDLLDRDLVGSLDLLERDPEGRLVVVDLKTAARKYTDLQVDASLQLSVYSYATTMNSLADQEDLRLRFDVLTKTKAPELHRYWTTRDRAPTAGSSGWPARYSRRSRPASSPRIPAGRARTARSGAGAGCGGNATGRGLIVYRCPS